VYTRKAPKLNIIHYNVNWKKAKKAQISLIFSPPAQFFKKSDKKAKIQKKFLKIPKFPD
jgi:hypothetical protein